MTERKGKLIAFKIVKPEDELMIISEEGSMIRVFARDISSSGRATQGVKIINLADSDSVSACAHVPAKKDEDEEEDSSSEPTLDLEFTK